MRDMGSNPHIYLRYLLMYSENKKIKYMNGENIDGKKTKI
jgi:hypothetical protein